MKVRGLFKKLVNIIMITGMLLGVASGFSGPSQAYASDPQIAATEESRTLPVSETGLYIVQLIDPSVPMYKGGIASLAATSPEVTGVLRLDPTTPASLAYAEYLDSKHEELITNMESAFGHPIDVQFRYQFALNAIAVNISHDEALQAFDLPGVAAVFPDLLYQLDTDMGPTLIGAPSIWNGDTIGGVATQGEGIVIGMIDSGINSEHPSFAEVGDDGFPIVNPYGSGVFHGWCVANPSFCNNKLIGAYGLNPNGGSPEDTDGHGSHTASTAGGNALDADFEVGGEPFTRAISGVAPHANIVAYKVCNPSCPSSASIAAVNLAIGSDEVDVINFSISGSSNPWNDGVDLAFLNAFAAGIFVSASAGNGGPGPGTVAHVGPWNSTVAASTHSRIIANMLDVTALDGTLIDLPAVPGEAIVIGADITDNIRWAGDVNPANINACVAFPAGSFNGVIGLAQRGACTFDIKVTNLFNAGAVGAVIYNNAGGPPITMGAVPTNIPSVMITLDDGLEVAALISGDNTAEVTIYQSALVIVDPAWEDIMAGFSSRGPSLFELVKPDYTAPGVNILAAYAATADPVQYAFLQGTSMSSPHSTGSSALMMALRPTWTVAELRSAMNSTANPVPVKDDDGVSPADPWDMGSGRLDLFGAGNAGLVLDETATDYQAANPGTGGDPSTLNQPSMVDYACMGTCSWTRTVKSVLPAQGTWNVTTDSGADWSIDVTPAQFTLNPGATVELTITADVTGAPAEAELFGAVTLTPGAGFTTRLPVVVRVAALTFPSISVDPLVITSTQAAELVTVPMTITNSGDGDLTWTISDASANVSWSDNFDSYATGSSMHGQGGWKGWGNLPAATAYTSDLFARSLPNSVEIVGASDLVHEYSGYSSGVWAYTAWQYIPSACSGETYFILLNQYDDTGATDNWSTQVNFNCVTSTITNEGPAGGTLAMVKDQWMEIRVEIDLDIDQQTFFYGNDLLFRGSWTDGMSGDGILNIAAVDLFANSATEVYYDDISLGQLVDAPWLSTNPTSGTTLPLSSSPVNVLLDATGMTPGTYMATLYVESNDLVNPVIAVPVTMIVQASADLAITKADSADPVKVGDQFTYTLSVSNNGPDDASGVVVVDTLPAGVTFVSASLSCVEAGGVVTCTIGDLANAGSVELSIVVIAPSAVGTITNTATVSGNEIDANLSNNTDSEDTIVESGLYITYLPIILK